MGPTVHMLPGSGKTTMIKLLCRLYDPQEGQILLNGVDVFIQCSGNGNFLCFSAGNLHAVISDILIKVSIQTMSKAALSSV